MVSVALVGLVLIGAACSNDKAEPSQPTPASLAKSTVHGLNVLPNAVADPASSTPGHEVYRLAGRAPENVVSFYRSGLAFTDSSDQLGICTQKLTPPYELTWRVGDTNDFVVVQVEGDGATPPGSILTIVDDKANPTRTCDAP